MKEKKKREDVRNVEEEGGYGNKREEAKRREGES